MSRRRGEFEHRTSIFEGAFRAWSHLGGLQPDDIEQKSVAELDPLSHPLENDLRTKDAKPNNDRNADGSRRRLYAYEPLPRSGLSHPYVQAILSPWLGPDADHDAIQLGLTTLRTWWQHRRKGESGSAIAALGTDKMRGVVEGYTRHFFDLAYCLVVNDKEQPPRTLYAKMKELEKARNKRNKKRVRDEEAGKLAALAAGNSRNVGNNGSGVGGLKAVQTNPAIDDDMSPLERLHAEQRRHLLESGSGIGINNIPVINMKGKCVPGKIDLGGIVSQVNHHASQLAHRGSGAGSNPAAIPSSAPSSSNIPAPQYGDPNKTPVVFVSENGDIQIAMSVDGITCAHCVKIVETVLKGCNGNKSPIEGLLDAAADRALCKVLIKIDQSGSAKRIAFECARNLAMVGYTAKALEMDIVNAGADKKATMDLGALCTAFEVVANTEKKDVFNWNIPCTCPDNGVLRDDCARHSQMNTRIFEAFHQREEEVQKFMAGCGLKYGMDCTCGPGCRCKNCSEHCKERKEAHAQQVAQQQNGLTPAGSSCCAQAAAPDETDNLEPHSINHPDSYQMPPPAAAAMPNVDIGQNSQIVNNIQHQGLSGGGGVSNDFPLDTVMAQRKPSIIGEHMVASRNPSMVSDLRNNSIISFGNRHMSITSETTFGRAMSGLSALSIDWENMDDFDVNVDHSAHINNQAAGQSVAKDASLVAAEDKLDGIAAGCAMLSGGECDCGSACVCAGCPVHDIPTPLPQQPAYGTKRSSLRRNMPVNPNAEPAQVSFKV